MEMTVRIPQSDESSEALGLVLNYLRESNLQETLQTLSIEEASGELPPAGDQKLAAVVAQPISPGNFKDRVDEFRALAGIPQ
jgi:hypothetical protein